MKIVLFMALCLLAACSTKMLDKEKNMASENQFSYSSVKAYRIGVDDILIVNVWKNPDLSVTVPVRPDGKISVPLIGDILAGGKEPMQVAEDVRVALSTFIRQPQVAVILSDLRSHEFISRVRITGAVNNPVSIPFRQGMTVLDAILEAGGTNDYASSNRAKLYRKESNKAEQYDILLDDILNSGGLETNYTLIPGDIISVPERLF